MFVFNTRLTVDCQSFSFCQSLERILYIPISTTTIVNSHWDDKKKSLVIMSNKFLMVFTVRRFRLSREDTSYEMRLTWYECREKYRQYNDTMNIVYAYCGRYQNDEIIQHNLFEKNNWKMYSANNTNKLWG